MSHLWAESIKLLRSTVVGITYDIEEITYDTLVGGA